MLFTITGKHFDVTDEIKAHAQEKTEKLPRYFDGISQVEVIVDGNGSDPGVEVIARGEHGLFFVASESGDDVMTCIDLAVHKLEGQLRRKKDKQRNNKHIPGAGEVQTGLESEED